MSAAGDRMRTRFGGLRVRIVVPELKGIVPDDSQGDPAVYGAPFTIKESMELQRFIDADSPEGFAEVVMRKSLDEQGERIFDIGDKQILMQCCEAHIVSRLGRGLMASIDIEEAAGN
jgi:hypothetical protein